MYKKVLCLLVVVVLCGIANAQTPYQIYPWAPESTGVWAGAASGDFNDPTMWRDGVVPGAGTVVKCISKESDFTADQLNLIETASYGEGEAWMEYACGEAARQMNSPALWTAQNININSPVNVNQFNVGDRIGTKTVLNINSNVTANRMSLSGYVYSVTTVNQNSGNVTVNGEMRMPHAYNGVYNLYDGNLKVTGTVAMPKRGNGYESGMTFAQAGKLGNLIYDNSVPPAPDGSTPGGQDPPVPTGHTTLDNREPIEFAKIEMNLFGGTADLHALYFGEAPPTALVHGVVTIYDGATLLLDGDVRSNVATWRTQGYMAPGIAGELFNVQLVDIGGVTKTQITVPEPATMMLLGLGAFGLIRRNRK